MKCKYCGEDLMEGAKFCVYCGKQIDIEEPKMVSEQMEVSTQVPEEPPMPTPEMLNTDPFGAVEQTQEVQVPEEAPVGEAPMSNPEMLNPNPFGTVEQHNNI